LQKHDLHERLFPTPLQSEASFLPNDSSPQRPSNAEKPQGVENPDAALSWRDTFLSEHSVDKLQR
jgi:hypothetical protein